MVAVANRCVEVACESEKLVSMILEVVELATSLRSFMIKHSRGDDYDSNRSGIRNFLET